MAKLSSSIPVIIARCLLAVLGGYLVTYTATAALARVLPVKPVDAVVIAALSGFLIYLAFIIWSFAAARVRRVAISVVLAVPFALLGFWPQIVGGAA
ncbi:iron transporter [Ectopseudomonas mendocina]|jgi:hypothetical protein|uniref:iron transporter n=1 Tax=Ectopseudomonas mendocina TaxID=300 RepID=UPI00313302F7